MATTDPNPYAPPADPFVVRDQAPPPPQAVYTQTRYQPYETDRFAQAYEWATKQTMIDYPGQRSTLERLDALIRQYMAGNTQQQKGR